MTEKAEIRKAPLLSGLLGWLFAGVGLIAWAYLLFLIHKWVTDAPRVAYHDEGANNLGYGIGLLLFGGLASVASLLALIGALIAKRYARTLPSQRILRIATILNACLVSGAFVGLIYISVSRQ